MNKQKRLRGTKNHAIFIDVSILDTIRQNIANHCGILTSTRMKTVKLQGAYYAKQKKCLFGTAL